jgi:peptidoglycan-associated lipoprotein
MMNARTITMLAVLCMGMAGCSSTSSTAPDTVAKPESAAPANKANSAEPARSASNAASPAGPAAKRSIYFEFNEAAIRPEYESVVALNAATLSKDPKRAIRVEGNTDERGSKEYNLALGNKRAASVARAMQVLGVAASRVEVVSFGEEKPRAKGHDEAAWAENRRVDIAY